MENVMEHNAHHDVVHGVPITTYNTLEAVLTEYAIYSRMRWFNDAKPIVEYTHDGGLMLALFNAQHQRWDVIYHDRELELAPIAALRRVDEHLQALEQSLALPLPPANPVAQVAALAVSIPRGMLGRVR